MNRSSRRGRMGAAALTLALFASACGSASPEAAAPSGASPDEAAPAEEQGGAGLPQLVATTVAGQQIDTNDLADQDVVVWFWAPW